MTTILSIVLLATLLPALSFSQDCIDYVDYDIDYGRLLHWVSGIDTPGWVVGVVTYGNYAYLGANLGGLLVVDIDDPHNPRLVNSMSTPGYSRWSAVSANYLYHTVGGASDCSFWVYDITDPEAPQSVGSVALPGSIANYVALSGNHAYITCDDAGLIVIDISDPANPVPIAHAPMPGHTGGVAISGDYAFVANWTLGLQVVDITRPFNPQTISSEGIPGSYRGIAIAGECIYTADEDSGLHVIDISDIENPQRLATLPGSANDVVIQGHYALVTGNDHGLWVVDIMSPADPQITGTVSLSNEYTGIAIEDDYAFIGANFGGLQVIDVTVPEDDPILGGVARPNPNQENRAVAVSGSLAYVATGSDYYGGGVYVVDFANLEEPQITGSVETLGDCHDVAVSGVYAYVTDRNNGLHVVRNVYPAYPNDPQVLSSLPIPDRAIAVATTGSHVCVAAYLPGAYGCLYVVDISNPWYPLIVASVDLPAWPHAVIISGDHAYVTAGIPGEYSGLFVIDIATPFDPQIVGSVSTPGYATGIAISGNYACIADRSSGIQMISIADPHSPQLVGRVYLQDEPKSVAISDDYAYVLGSWSRFNVIDITNPEAPQITAGMNRQNPTRDVAVMGDHIIVADNRWVKIQPKQCPADVSVEGDPETPDNNDEIPGAFGKLEVYPNPFNPQTTIEFTLEREEWASVSAYDLTGRRLDILAESAFKDGRHNLTWNGRDSQGRSMPSGTYIIRLETESGVEARKAMLVR